MRSPAIGTYLRPVGHIGFCYCYRLDRVVQPQDLRERPVWLCTRFGLDRQTLEPVADHLVDGHRIDEPVHVAPGVWRDPQGDPWDIEPMYWREMGPRGQLSLF